MKEKHKSYDPDKKPSETFREEMENRGSTFIDNEEQSAARDAAKIEKARTGQSQKMDTVKPEDLIPDRNDELIEKRRRNEL